MRAILIFCFYFLPSLAMAQDITLDEINKCKIAAANSAIEINPAYNIVKIENPIFTKNFEDKDELGKPVYGLQFDGKMNFSVGDLNGLENYSCFFISQDKVEWVFNWAGIGPTDFK